MQYSFASCNRNKLWVVRRGKNRKETNMFTAKTAALSENNLHK